MCAAGSRHPRRRRPPCTKTTTASRRVGGRRRTSGPPSKTVRAYIDNVPHTDHPRRLGGFNANYDPFSQDCALVRGLGRRTSPDSCSRTAADHRIARSHGRRCIRQRFAGIVADHRHHAGAGPSPSRTTTGAASFVLGLDDRRSTVSHMFDVCSTPSSSVRARRRTRISGALARRFDALAFDPPWAGDRPGRCMPR